MGVDLDASTAIRIVLVSDDRMMRDGLRALFSHESTTQVVGEINDGPQAHERVRESKPDLVVTDIASWACGSVETIRQISQTASETKIIVMSAFCSKTFIAQTLTAGAHGYVVRMNGFSELLQAVQIVSSGAAYLCPKAREIVLGDYAVSGASGAPSEALLTDRECTVLRLLAEGRTSKQIALTLDVSSKTIDACRRRLMKKLGVETAADLIKSAIVMGLTTVAPSVSKPDSPSLPSGQNPVGPLL